jgi:GT2 family glycosyltransferase/glycosyltransferase involved in cell wall biosynthesis/ubiquinone/menaquinone biosynthesis C-methylase UbiE/CII-binding regulator of phage lambda lysogenization HflD
MLEWTGERYLPDTDPSICGAEIHYEHLHRYAFASQYIKGKKVLDLASGEGYGAFLLSKSAESVTGIEIDPEAVNHASKVYKTDNLTFFQGSIINIPIAGEKLFDIIVCFEAIEHIQEHEFLLLEIKRLIKDDGILIISTPNKQIYSDDHHYKNPFHMREIYYEGFCDLLKKQFAFIYLFGQQVYPGSSIFPKNSKFTNDLCSEFVISYEGDHFSFKNNDEKQALYFIALASDKEISKDRLHKSFLTDISNKIVTILQGQLNQCTQSIQTLKSDVNFQITGLEKSLSDVNDQITKLTLQNITLQQTIISKDKQIQEVSAQVSNLNQHLAAKDKQIQEVSAQVSNLNQHLAAKDQQLIETQANLTQLTSSTSWKITFPVREVGRWLTNPSSQAKRYAQEGAKFGKAVFMRCPLSHETRTKFRFFLANHAPWVFRASDCHPPLSVPALHKPKGIPQPIADLDTVASSINLTTSLQPIVSVIIPIYGKCDYTLRCLTSIAANPPSIPFEVIVVDDCSPDNSGKVLQKVEGIRLIPNQENQGFIRSCNIGAKIARGQYLHFLNNDTEVTTGWLDELIRTFQEFPDTGLAGSKLVYPDGTLQEAGGIIWQDGSAWNFGHNQDQLLPIYNYAREVDYCSGASIMVPKVLYEELGGFDEYYLPAYCEDADLALKIRDRGLRVIYQPLSIVVHYEGVTSGTDITQGTKAYQVENSKKLFVRWKDCLQRHQAPGIDVDRAKDRMAKRRALVLDFCTPTPDQDAGSLTAFNLMLLLREMDFQVTFIPEDNFMYMPGYTQALQRIGIEILYAPYCTSVKQHLQESGERYDLAFLFRAGVIERNLDIIRKYCPRAKVLFHTIDLHYLRMSREAALLGDSVKQQAADEMKQRELAVIRAADASIVHSTTEFALLHQELPEERIHVFPLILDIRRTIIEFKDRRDIVFVGSYLHAPNVDAVQYFVHDIMPILRHRLPGVRFFIAGNNPTSEIQALASDDIIITGFVEDLSSLLDRMRISVAPLRYGAGIKGKIGTAMAVGLPIVATSLAAEGMLLTKEENILIADSPEAFADAVIRLYNDELLWSNLSKAGLDFAETAFGAETAYRTLDKILNDAGIKSTRRSRTLRLYSSSSFQS